MKILSVNNSPFNAFLWHYTHQENLKMKSLIIRGKFSIKVVKGIK